MDAASLFLLAVAFPRVAQAANVGGWYAYIVLHVSTVYIIVPGTVMYTVLGTMYTALAKTRPSKFHINMYHVAMLMLHRPRSTKGEQLHVHFFTCIMTPYKSEKRIA